MERKLELGMEGHAFFDYTRWGVTVAEITAYTTYEKKWRAYFIGAVAGPEDIITQYLKDKLIYQEVH